MTVGIFNTEHRVGAGNWCGGQRGCHQLHSSRSNPFLPVLLPGTDEFDRQKSPHSIHLAVCVASRADFGFRATHRYIDFTHIRHSGFDPHDLRDGIQYNSFKQHGLFRLRKGYRLSRNHYAAHCHCTRWSSLQSDRCDGEQPVGLFGRVLPTLVRRRLQERFEWPVLREHRLLDGQCRAGRSGRRFRCRRESGSRHRQLCCRVGDDCFCVSEHGCLWRDQQWNARYEDRPDNRSRPPEHRGRRRRRRQQARSGGHQPDAELDLGFPQYQLGVHLLCRKDRLHDKYRPLGS